MNITHLIYKNLLCSDYAIKSPATIYLQVARELLKTMTSSRCLATMHALFIGVYL